MKLVLELEIIEFNFSNITCKTSKYTINLNQWSQQYSLLEKINAKTYVNEPVHEHEACFESIFLSKAWRDSCQFVRKGLPSC